MSLVCSILLLRRHHLCRQAGLTSPKRYSCSPHAPTAFMTLALCTTRTRIPLSRALSCRSVCVVALGQEKQTWIWLQSVKNNRGLCCALKEGMTYPNGSPTTRKATSSLSAPSRILSAACHVQAQATPVVNDCIPGSCAHALTVFSVGLTDSTISLSAMTTSLPYKASCSKQQQGRWCQVMARARTGTQHIRTSLDLSQRRMEV